MKSNLIFSSLLSFSFLFMSCKKESEAEVTSSEAPQEVVASDTLSTTDQNSGDQSATQNVAVNPNQAATTGQTIMSPQAPVTAKAGMNPAHGQPGHRCDIAVGAPLNSPVAKPGTAITSQTIPTQTTTTQPATTPNFTTTDAPGTATTTPVVTAPGMNPPHGQAGHKCDIAVGAPLPKQ